MQRMIIAALSSRQSGDWVGPRSYLDDYRLAEGWHDLRKVLKELARARGATYSRYVESSFQASFSRAVGSLQKAGLIKFSRWLVPLAEFSEYADQDRIEFLSDGNYLKVANRQRRFLRLANVPSSVDDPGESIPTRTHEILSKLAAQSIEPLPSDPANAPRPKSRRREIATSLGICERALLNQFRKLVIDEYLRTNPPKSANESETAN